MRRFTGLGLGSAAVKLYWNPPPLPSIHGELMGYKILYYPLRNATDSVIQLVKDPAATVSGNHLICFKILYFGAIGVS